MQHQLFKRTSVRTSVSKRIPVKIYWFGQWLWWFSVSSVWRLCIKVEFVRGLNTSTWLRVWCTRLWHDARQNRLTPQIHPSFRGDLTPLIWVNMGCCTVSGNHEKQLGNWDMDCQGIDAGFGWLTRGLTSRAQRSRGKLSNGSLSRMWRWPPLLITLSIWACLGPAMSEWLSVEAGWVEFVSRLEKCCMSRFVVSHHECVDKSCQSASTSSSWQVDYLLAGLFPPCLTPR